MKKFLSLILSALIMLIAIPVYSVMAGTALSVLQTVTDSTEVQNFVNNNVQNNLLLGIEPVVSEEGTSGRPAGADTGGWEALTDGNYTGGDAANRKSVFPTGDEGATGIIRISYELRRRVTVSDLLVVCRENKANDYGFDYEIYVSDYFGTLFDTDNLVFTKTNDNYAEGGQLISFGEKSGITGSFVGFRITDANNYKYHIGELGVYGSAASSLPVVTDSALQAQAVKDFAAGNVGENLLAGLTPTAFEERADGGLQTLNVTDPYSNLTDGEYSTRISVFMTGNGTGVYRFTYTLSERTEISDLLVVCREDKVNDFGFDYEIYVSDHLETLYYEESLVFTKTKDMYEGGGQHIALGDDIRPKGTYLGIRITDYAGKQSGNEYRYHISEFGVYGTKAESIPVVTDSALQAEEVKNFAAEKADGNLLSGLTPTAFEEREDGGLQELSIFGSGYPGITDGDYSTYMACFMTGSGIGIYRFTYTLPERTEISDFLAVCREDKVNDYGFDYEIYVSDEVETLYSAENLVFAKTKDKYSGGAQHIALAEDIRPSGKYFGFRITDYAGIQSGGEYRYHISELGIYGKKAETLIALQLTASDDSSFDVDTVELNKDYLFEFKFAENGYYTVRHLLSGLYITLDKGNIYLAERDVSNTNQLWKMDDTSELYGEPGLIDIIGYGSDSMAMNAVSGELSYSDISGVGAADGRSWKLGNAEELTDGLICNLSAYIKDGSCKYLSVNNTLWGDLNGDSSRDILDLIVLKKMAAGTVSSVEESDLDVDGAEAGAGDMAVLREVLLGFSPSKGK